MKGFDQQILRTESSGMPLEWISYQEAARLYYLGHVAYSCGSKLYTLHGGVNAKSGQNSLLDIHSIIATEGNSRAHHHADHFLHTPLDNKSLFKRDAHLCLYCGQSFKRAHLSRDHVTPISQGGQDEWNNVVSACVRCNNHKAGRTPEQANMELLAIPFTPTYAEYIYLQGRSVLADQMEFLLAHFPRHSPLRERLSSTQK